MLPASSPSRARAAQDVGFAVGIVFILTVLFLPLPAVMIDIGLAFSIALSVLILMVALWIQRPLDFSAFPTVLLLATLLRLSLNIATTRLILSNGAEGYDGRRPRHRRLRQLRHERRLRHRHHRVRHPDHGQFRGHHQGRHAHRRGRRALHPRCHPRQADGDRRRPQRRPDRRQGGDPPPARAGGGKRLLRLHGRRLQVRARRCHRRPHHHGRQRVRRHRHRRDPPRHVAGRRGRRVHQAVGRRRPRHADPGADRLAGGRPAGVEGRHARLGREGDARPSSATIRALCCWPRWSCSCWRWRRGCRCCPSRCWAAS